MASVPRAEARFGLAAMSSPRARGSDPPSAPADRATRPVPGRRSKATNEDDAASDDEAHRGSLAPLAHHALATVVYCLVGYALWLANSRDITADAPELTDAEKRLLHYQSHPTAWVQTRLPTTGVGWLSFGVGAWMAWNWSRRVYRVKKILDARRAANAGALSRARLANADVKRVGEREAAEAARRATERLRFVGDDETERPAPPLVLGDAVNPCSDPRCLRCRPSAHETALARNALKLRERVKDDPKLGTGKLGSKQGVSAGVMALASGGGVAAGARGPRRRNKIRSKRNTGESSLQAPTVFSLPELCAVPIHNRHGRGCVDANARRGGGNFRGFKLRLGTDSEETCACASIWGEPASEESDVAILERAAPAIRREVLEAAFAPRSRRRKTQSKESGKEDEKNDAARDDDVDTSAFAPFDPAVRKGGDWSAVYLYRNGVKDRRNCEAFPAATAAIESLRDGCFGGGVGDTPGAPSGCAFGSAYISKLAPDTLITPHCGPCNARLRCSLGLDVPRRTFLRANTSPRKRFEGLVRWLFSPGKKKALSRRADGDENLDENLAPAKAVIGRRSRSRQVFDSIVSLCVFVFRLGTFPVCVAFRVLAFVARAAGAVARPFVRVANAALSGEGFPRVVLGADAGALAPACELRVANATTAWSEGSCVLFDDSFVHSAEFRRGASAEEEDAAGYEPGALARDRIVLIVDLWHPQLSAADRVAIRTLYPPGMGATAEAHQEETEGRKANLAEFAAGAVA